MKAILVDSAKREIREVEFDGSDASLESLIGGKRLVKGDLGVWGGKMAVCESVSETASKNYTMLQYIPVPLVGNAVIWDCPKTIEQIRDGIKFVDADTMVKLIESAAQIVKSIKPLVDLAKGSGGIGKIVKEEPKPLKVVPENIKPEIKGEAHAMLDILSEKLENKK